MAHGAYKGGGTYGRGTLARHAQERVPGGLVVADGVVRGTGAVEYALSLLDAEGQPMAPYRPGVSHLRTCER